MKMIVAKLIVIAELYERLRISTRETQNVASLRDIKLLSKRNKHTQGYIL